MARQFVVVDAPQNRPPRGATLLRSANPVPEESERWVSGLTWVPEACGSGSIVGATGLCGGMFSGFTAAGDWPDDWELGDAVEYLPPHVAVGQKCSAIGGENELRAIEDRARRLLESCGTVGVARELWRGDVAQDAEVGDPVNPFLADASGGAILTSGGASMLEGLALLEQALAECSCGGAPMIHVMPRVVTAWSYLDLVERLPDGRLITALGTLVVADPGYDGSGADGTPGDADGSWAYGTSMVDVRLGAVVVRNDREQIRRANDFVVYASRPFAATFDPCCHVAAQLDHTTLT